MAVDEECLPAIQILVGMEFLHLVGDATNAREAWSALEAYFQSKVKARQLELNREFAQLKMEHKETVSMYFARAQRLRHDMLAAKAVLKNSEYKLRLVA